MLFKSSISRNMSAQAMCAAWKRSLDIFETNREVFPFIADTEAALRYLPFADGFKGRIESFTLVSRSITMAVQCVDAIVQEFSLDISDPETRKKLETSLLQRGSIYSDGILHTDLSWAANLIASACQRTRENTWEAKVKNALNQRRAYLGTAEP